MSTVISTTQTRLHSHADVAGATASGLCLIHCLLTPVAISFFPGIVPYLPGDTWVHRMLAIGIVLMGAVAFIPGYRLHRRRSLLALIGAGISLILVVAWSGETMNEAKEIALSVSGSAMLVAAHLLNRSFCRQCHSCETTSTCKTTSLGV
ncbi:MAG TPA: MerC domain-containing protein [Edaphobacter sp.]